MNQQPELRTERLLLRPFIPQDAATVQQLARDRAIADTTLNIPHPYPDDLAAKWISAHAPRFRDGRGAIFAITLLADGSLVGSIGLVTHPTHNRAELGYWMGRPYWNQGYTTEAARAIIRYGFEDLGLNRIFAYHFRRNPASERVMQKIGMQSEGMLRQHVQKWGVYEDLGIYAILKSNHDAT